MSKLDAFTKRRVLRVIEEVRARTGQLPTLLDFKANHIEEESLRTALKEKLIEVFYVTLTSGTIVKAFKASSELKDV